MKKILIAVCQMFLTFYSAKAQSSYSQVTSCISMDSPGYIAAQAKLDKISITWKNDLDSRFLEIEKRSEEYAADLNCPADLKKKRENDIAFHLKELNDLQETRFGLNGELFQLRLELMKNLIKG